MIIKISQKVPIWLKKLSSIKIVPISKDEIFAKSTFDPLQICKIVLIHSSRIWNFNATDLLYV